MRHQKKPIRIFSDLKNVITENCAKKQSDPTLEPNRLKNCHNNRQQYPVLGGYNKKHIRNFSDLKNVTNAASRKTYPNFFGLEKCHECGIKKNLSEFFRT